MATQILQPSDPRMQELRGKISKPCERTAARRRRTFLPRRRKAGAQKASHTGEKRNKPAAAKTTHSIGATRRQVSGGPRKTFRAAGDSQQRKLSALETGPGPAERTARSPGRPESQGERRQVRGQMEGPEGGTVIANPSTRQAVTSGAALPVTRKERNSAGGDSAGGCRGPRVRRCGIWLAQVIADTCAVPRCWLGLGVVVIVNSDRDAVAASDEWRRAITQRFEN